MAAAAAAAAAASAPLDDETAAKVLRQVRSVNYLSIFISSCS
jgi:hypothetical protein